MIAKSSIYIFSIFLFTGCCYKGPKSQYGLPRKKIKGLEEPSSYANIDTLALYKTDINFHLNSFTKEYVDYEKDINNSYPYASYLKFYPDGKFGIFIIPKKDTLKLERSFFDPAKAKMGYYWTDGKSIKTKLSTIGDCSLFISSKKGEISGDKITLQDNSYTGNIYVKHIVPVALLMNWKPDW